MSQLFCCKTFFWGNLYDLGPAIISIGWICLSFIYLVTTFYSMSIDTVDGRNPAPHWMYKTLKIMGKTTYQLVQDFFHQQYHYLYHLLWISLHVLFSFSRPFASLSVSDGPKDELERSTIPGTHCGEEKTKHLPLSPNHIHKNIVIKLQSRPWFQTFCYLHPDPWGNDPIWRAYYFFRWFSADNWCIMLVHYPFHDWTSYELWDSSRFGHPVRNDLNGSRLVESWASWAVCPPHLSPKRRWNVGGSSPLWKSKKLGNCEKNSGNSRQCNNVYIYIYIYWLLANNCI